ncbi:MAG: phage tail spike protein [Erysipelotrichaceae bacterium]
MIKIYEPTEVLFDHNGLKILHPTKAEIYIEDNGDYYIDVESSIDDLEYLQEGMIIRAATRWGEQGFRLTNPVRKNNKISVKGYHLWKDSSKYIIFNSYVENKNCNDALDHLNSACDVGTPFTTISDITTINSTRIVRQSLEEAIATVIEKWGGHLYRDNWVIGVKSKIGEDRGITIKYGKNSTNIEANEDWSNVVTKIIPVGYDGITLPEKYLEAETQYSVPYTKVIKFEQDINQDDYKDEKGNLKEEEYKEALIEDLRNKAKSYLNENQYFKCNYKVKAHIEGVIDLGDVIVVEHKRLGINLTTNVISLKYDCIRDKYIEIEFGNFKTKLKDLVSNIDKQTKETVANANEVVKVTLQNELNTATSKIWGTLGDSYVIYEGDRILVVDSLPKETAANVMMINAGGIGFSNTGINGSFNSAWLIDGTLDMQAVNCINMTANLVKGGTFKVGSQLNEAGRIEIYDLSNVLIGTFDENGIVVFGKDGSKVVINPDEFAGYDFNGVKTFWMNGDEFHMRKSVVEEEITLCGLARWLGIETTDNTGIGIVPLT